MNDDPDLRTVKIFMTVCHTLNMTEAARRLNITQSAISHSILGLERFIGEPLFDRQTRPISLTSVGHILFESAQHVDASFHAFQSTIDKVKAGKLPHLRIGLTSALPSALAPLLTSAIGEYVDRVTIRTGLTPDLHASVLASDIDMSVMIERPKDDGLVTYGVLTEPYLIAVPTSYGSVDNIGDLIDLSRKLPFIRWMGGYMGRDIEAHLKRLRVFPPERFALDDRNAVMHTVGAGLGWAVVPPLSAFDVWQNSTNIRLHPFPGAVFQHRLVAAHKPGQFGWVAKRSALVLREIVRERLIPHLAERAPWLSETIILTTGEK